MSALDELPDPLELLRVQSRQPAPGTQPGPMNQDALRGYGQPPAPRRQPAAPMATPQVAPQPTQQAQPTPAQGDPTADWVQMMGRHNVDKGRWPDLTEQVYGVDRQGVRPSTGNPALDADIESYARRYPGIGRVPDQPATPPAQMAPQARQPQQSAPRDELPDPLDMLRGGGTGAAPSAQPSPQASGSRMGTVRNNRDLPTRMRETVYGRQDPAYAGIPSAMRALDATQGFSVANEAGNLGRYALAASDDDLARMYAQQFGDSFVRTEKDANGYPVIVYRDRSGQEAKAYVNRPGLDVEDVTRGVVGALPFLKSAQSVNRLVQAAPVVPRMIAQAAGQGATSIAQDATGILSGLTQPDPADAITKAGVAAVGGAGGEAIGAAGSAIWRRLIGDRRYYDSTSQTLTKAGQDAARAAGIDPADFNPQIAQDFAREFARTGNANAAFRQAASNEVGIRRSAGELTGNREQLLREQQMRGGTFGTQAREAAEAFDAGQRDDVMRAVRGVSPPGAQSRSFAETIAPDRRSMLASGMGKTEAGDRIAANTAAARASAQEQTRAAWKDVSKIEASDEALQMLPKFVNDALGSFELGTTTPAASKMAQQVGRFVRGEAPNKVDDILTNDPGRNVDQVRRQLLGSMRGASTDEDRAAAGAVYSAYNRWMRDAADKMVTNDPLAAAKLRTAIDSTRDMMQLFKGQPGTPAARIMADLVEKADNPARFVDTLFTGPASQVKQGSLTALQQLKAAYDRYLPAEQAKRAWDDVRLAYWLKMTADKGNEVKTPGNLAASIKTMLGDQKALTRAMFSPQETAQLRRMALALDEIKRKNPNTSWSAIGGGQLMRDMFNAVLQMLGWNTVVGRTMAGTAARPFAAAYGQAQSARAFGGAGDGAVLPALPAPSRAGFGGATGAQSQQQ